MIERLSKEEMALLASVWKDVVKTARRAIRERRLPPLASRRFHAGFCPICDARTIFVQTTPNLREDYLCVSCRSIPRFRAVLAVLELHFPDWRAMAIHESSPGGASSDKIRRECSGYIGSQWFPDGVAGAMKDGFRCENLEQQTFEDARFDMVLTQDVFEHVLHPDHAFGEIARTLKPGGVHLFTLPWHYWQPTRVRAREENGVVRHLLEAQYHGNPIDAKGSLVVTDWGWDLCDFIKVHSGLDTTAIRIHDRRQGIEAQFIEVFISRKHDRDQPDTAHNS